MGKSARTEKGRIIKGGGAHFQSFLNRLPYIDRHRDSETQSWEEWVPLNTWNIWNSWWHQSPAGLTLSGLSILLITILRDRGTDLPGTCQRTLPNSPSETLGAWEIQELPYDLGCTDAAKNQQCLKRGKCRIAHTVSHCTVEFSCQDLMGPADDKG